MVASVSGNLSHPVYARQISAEGPQGAGRALRLDTAPLSLPRSLCLAALYLLPVSVALKSSVCKVFLPAYRHLPSPEQTHARLARSGFQLQSRFREISVFLWQTKSHTTAHLVSTHRCNYSYVVTRTVSWMEWKSPEKKNVFVSTKNRRKRL